MRSAISKHGISSEESIQSVNAEIGITIGLHVWGCSSSNSKKNGGFLENLVVFEKLS